MVFTYLDAFDEDRGTVERLKAEYRAGGLGDMVVKRRLEEQLQALIAPIRERREQLARDPGHVFDMLREGTQRAKDVTQATLDEVRAALGTFSFDAVVR
jgi:tryptophanyl-tRNA synthetase